MDLNEEQVAERDVAMQIEITNLTPGIALELATAIKNMVGDADIELTIHDLKPIEVPVGPYRHRPRRRRVRPDYDG